MPDKLSQLVADLDDKLFLEGERYEQSQSCCRRWPIGKLR